jgi:hypothetical protein
LVKMLAPIAKAVAARHVRNGNSGASSARPVMARPCFARTERERARRSGGASGELGVHLGKAGARQGRMSGRWGRESSMKATSRRASPIEAITRIVGGL